MSQQFEQVEQPEDVVERVSELHDGQLEIKPEMRDHILELLTQAGAIVSAGRLAMIPTTGTHIGGSALLACGLIVADLQTGGNGPAVKTAEKIFGSAGKALEMLGLTACIALGGGAFHGLLKDGQLGNPQDSRWLIVAANAGPYLAGNLLNEPKLKGWVEKHFGETITLAYRADGSTRHMSAKTTQLYQQLAFAMGAAHVLAFGIINNDNVSTGIGASFLVAPLVAVGNQLTPTPIENKSMDRRGFLSASSKLVIQPLLSGDGQLIYDNLLALLGKKGASLRM